VADLPNADLHVDKHHLPPHQQHHPLLLQVTAAVKTLHLRF
jgi:hypothetical protein